MGDSNELVCGNVELIQKKKVKLLKGFGVSTTEVFKQLKKFE